MKGSKLLDWLEMLDGKERQRLRKFVASPYFNAHGDHARLLDLLLEGVSEKEVLWEGLYPGQVYDDLRLQVECLRGLRERGATELYSFVSRKYARRIAQSAPATADDFLTRYLLEAEHNAWLEHSANRSGQSRLQQALDLLDDFYILSKLKYACTVLNNQRVVDQPLNNVLIPGLLAHLDQQGEAVPPLIRLYRLVYRLLSEEGGAGAAYGDLREALEANLEVLPDVEARDLFAFAMNHCIGRINAGDGEYLGERLGMYGIALERGYLLEAGRLSPWDYKNITVTGLRLSEFGWVEKFIHAYRDRIAPEHRKNAFIYNLARLHFHRREYSESLRCLRELEFSDVFYGLDSRVMLLKLYYETSEVRSLDALIDSFRVFLHRNRLISDAHKANYLNLIRFVKKLSRLRPGDEVRYAQFRL